MPSLTTGELVLVLQNNDTADLFDHFSNPVELVKVIQDFLTKHQDIPVGVTISDVATAMQDLASREFGCKRSPQWDKVRKAHLKNHPECAVCGGTENLNVHHCKPYHLHPELELDRANLITLCEKSARYGWACHFVIGHNMSWHQYNTNVVKCAKYIRSLVERNRDV